MSVRSEGFSIRRIILFSAAGFLIISLLTVLLSPRLAAEFYPLPEDEGSSWYYWQLDELGAPGRIAVWGGYLVHQIAVWGIFFAARKEKKRAIARGERKPVVDAPFSNEGGETAGKYHLWMMVVNLFFVALHLLQTHLWYDGLAQDVPIWTSQGSVIVMLVLILVMEMPRRGLFFGRWRQVPAGLHRVLRNWHGPFIAWALVYTFWFHPMEGNWGLLSGFVYMFLLFIQMNIFGSRAHKRRSWVVVLEAFVVVHGTLISLYKNLDAWPLFFFGFLFMFLITYMHTWMLRPVIKWLIGAASLAVLIWVYSVPRGWEHVFEISFIPVALYGGALGLWLIGAAGERLFPNTQT